MLDKLGSLYKGAGNVICDFITVGRARAWARHVTVLKSSEGRVRARQHTSGGAKCFEFVQQTADQGKDNILVVFINAR